MIPDPTAYSPRAYTEIVRDLLTTLTGGTVRETHVVPSGSVIELRLLADRPIRRVSHLDGVIELERQAIDALGNPVTDTDGNPVTEMVPVPYRFGDSDFETFATGTTGEENDAIRFRKEGRKPPVGSTVTVNYYPTQTRPTPITDLNVGSVARTLLEAVGREISVQELLLEHVYKSAFLETAEGSSLDKVVALIGVRRRPPGVPTVNIRFIRAAGSTGRINVPTSTVVSDAEGNRYLTVAPLVLEPGEPSREVLAAGVSSSTAEVAEGALDRLEVLIAGISTVRNDQPSAPGATPESDDALRRRARGALAVAARGTLDALKFGLLSIDGVKDVALTEFPNGVPGEVRVDVAYEGDPSPEMLSEVAERIQDLRPAGVRVISGVAQSVPLSVSATITLAGSGVPGSQMGALIDRLEARLLDYIEGLPPGGTLRQAKAALAALADERIVDARFTFSTGGTPEATLTAPAGGVLDPAQPFDFTFETESGEVAPGQAVQVDMFVPLYLLPGITFADASAALNSAAADWVAGRDETRPIDVDSLMARLRDDTRYQLVRAETAVTTEVDGQFMQLADGIGVHVVRATDQVFLRNLNLDLRDGAP